MRVARPLRAGWLWLEGVSEQIRETLEQFFRRTLAVRDITAEDILGEFGKLAGGESLDDPTHPRDLYKKLNELWNGLNEQRKGIVT